jgi:hypothetical protein
VERIDRALLALDSRQTELREQLARERAVTQPARSPVARARESGRDMGLGL